MGIPIDTTEDTKADLPDKPEQPLSNGSASKPHSVHYSVRAGSPKLQIDDSFYKRAMVSLRVDSQDNPVPEEITDIYVPVPDKMAQESAVHETITSAYETNISINKLLRERHKGSLAAMGRLFGSKQKEIEAQKNASVTLLVGNKESNINSLTIGQSVLWVSEKFVEGRTPL